MPLIRPCRAASGTVLKPNETVSPPAAGSGVVEGPLMPSSLVEVGHKGSRGLTDLRENGTPVGPLLAEAGAFRLCSGPTAVLACGGYRPTRVDSLGRRAAIFHRHTPPHAGTTVQQSGSAPTHP